MRDLSSRLYYLIRRYVLEIANRREVGDDIFFMTFHEIFKDDRSMSPATERTTRVTVISRRRMRLVPVSRSKQSCPRCTTWDWSEPGYGSRNSGPWRAE